MLADASLSGHLVPSFLGGLAYAFIVETISPNFPFFRQGLWKIDNFNFVAPGSIVLQ